MDDFEEEGIGAVQTAFKAAVRQDYLELTEGAAAIAAAAVLAALRDGKIETIPEAYRDNLTHLSIGTDIIEPYRESAIEALDRVLAPKSELTELWSESNDFENWKQSVLDIRRRLSRN